MEIGGVVGNAWTEHCRVLSSRRYDVIRYNAITELKDSDEKKQMGQTADLYSGRECFQSALYDPTLLVLLVGES